MPVNILPLHLLTLAFVVWTIIQADMLGMSWIQGKKHTLDETVVKKHHRNTWIGLVGMMITGFLIFWPMREFLLHRPQFWVKMAFVASLVVNGFVIGRLQSLAIEKSYKELTHKEKMPLYVSATASTLSWLGAATLAFFLLPG